MSSKKLFESAYKTAQYDDYKTQKEAYEIVESLDNAAELYKQQQTFEPQINYKNPANFAKYGSAYYYYKGALDRVINFYPYDGSNAEQNKFYNELFPVEKYIFNNRYPRSTGYGVLSADGWGPLANTADGFGLPTTQEYITFKGGPNTGSAGSSLVAQGSDPESGLTNYGNVYDEKIYETAGLPDDYGKGTRLSNLRSNFEHGVTVEFWLQTGSLGLAPTTDKQIIVDMWNNEAAGSTNNDYGRITLLLDSTEPKPLTFIIESGSVTKTSTIGSNLAATDSFGDWQHYALTFYNTGSSFVSKLHVNGRLNETITSAGTLLEINSKKLMGRIGALITTPSGSSAPAGAGKLSGSIDEFRFWKVARNSKQIAENWFSQVGGGTNTDINNTELGVYFKFNEGITAVAATDSIVLDYAGRVSNAVWTGYGSNSRNTGSAIVSASAATKEHADPIVRINHPDYIYLESSLLESGSFYDSTNNSSFLSHAPSWVIEEHEDLGNDNLKIISHIVGTYFDKIRMMAGAIPTFKQVSHLSASLEPLPFAMHLPQSMGMHIPEIFIDATIREALLNRNDKEFFESKLKETKDLIYQNLYNNITNIYKSKGTEKAFRNVLRSFNIDDDLLRFKIYSNNQVYEIKDNLRQVIKTNKSLNFNDANQLQAVVYQRKDPLNPDSSGFISGSYGTAATYENLYGFTAEADVIFPKFFKSKSKFQRSFLETSLFGIATVSTASSDHIDGIKTTFVADDKANFQVSAVRDEADSKNVYFKLESLNHPNPLPTLTSSVFFDVYDNERWNLSVRIKPKDYPFSGFVSGSDPSTSRGFTYDVIFRGITSTLGVVTDSFEVTSSISYASGSGMSTSPKRVWAGAYKENLTGSTTRRADSLISNVKYWTKYLSNASLNQHLFDVDNSGISGSYKNISALDKTLGNKDIINQRALALEWNFDTLTGSSAGGTFTTLDFSSGSAVSRTNYGWHGKISGYQHDGYGYGFVASSTKAVNIERANSFKFIDPEENVSSNMIEILEEDDTLFERTETIPSYLITIEKSMYQAVSEEMLTFLAGVIDFNNIIGEPVNRYRGRYKSLEKLREVFFRRVTQTKDIEKFVAYYKWFDEALSAIFSQLIPASVDISPDITNTVESHVLERSKYETKFPTLEFNVADPSSPMFGTSEILYSPSFGGTTMPSSPRRTDKHIRYWKDRAHRSDPEITSGDTVIDAQRETIRRMVVSNPTLTSSNPVLKSRSGTSYNTNEYARRVFAKNIQLTIDNPNTTTIKGGTNFSADKNIEYTRTALYPAGPINTSGGIYVPQNILLSFVNDFAEITDFKDPLKNPIKKIKRYVGVMHGRDHEEGGGYSFAKSSVAFPFNIISSSVTGGYQTEVQNALGLNLEITNLHNDVYGTDMEKPMQGPFTEHNVGGLQYRHVAINKNATDEQNTRPEGWRILLGTVKSFYSGAIGMAGPDYPHPTDYDPINPYPNTSSKKAVYHRDFTAKSPVNIRNIHATGPVVLGNFRKNYEVISTFGAHSNPRQFIETQPTLPTGSFQNRTSGTTSIRTFLDVRTDRPHLDLEHFDFAQDYGVGYLSGTPNKTVIKTRFSAPGGIEVSTPGYTDFRSDEFSVYNALPFKNLSVIKPSQGPSGTLAVTQGIRVYDIHGLDYGLRSHLARHTARFGRDSLSVTNPGVSYTENPGFHKIHRNNIDRRTIEYCLVTSSVAGTGLTNDKGIDIAPPSTGVIAVVQSVARRTERVFDGAYAAANNNLVKFSFAGWIKPDAGGMNIFEFGYSGTSPVPTHRLRIFSSGELRYNFNTTDGSSFVGGYYATSATPITGSAWKHVVVTVSGTHGNLSNIAGRAVAFYVNGVEYASTYSGATPENFFPTSSVGVPNFRGYGSTHAKPVAFFGRVDSISGYEYTGEADEFSLYTDLLSSADTATLYNSGKPQNLTQSGMPASASLLSWWRMGDDPADDMSGYGSTGTDPKLTGQGNVIIDVVGGADIYFTVQSGNNLKSSTGSLSAALPGADPTIHTSEEPCSYPEKSLYDNYNISHQIPRSSKQYAWITASLVSDNGWIGFTPKDFKINSGSTRIDAYSFVSASDFGSYVNPSRIFGGAYADLVPLGLENSFLPQVSDLNLNVYEPIAAATNDIGYPITDALSKYRNVPLVPAVSVDPSPYLFNSIIIKRNGYYGWPTWKQVRRHENPVIRNERRNNKISLTNTANDGVDIYEMPPVSLRTRPVEVAYTYTDPDDGKIYNETADAMLQKTYFTSVTLNNRLFPSVVQTADAFNLLISSIPRTDINYVIYTENIFPSQRNEFMSRSTQRLGYENGFWHSDRETRTRIGAIQNRTYYPAGTDPSVAAGAYTRLNSFGVFMSSSAWPLDAPADFLTRTGAPRIDNLGPTKRDMFITWRAIGQPGELQNTSMSYLTGAYVTGVPAAPSFTTASFLERIKSFAPGALYASKHMISSPLSLTSPYGIHTPEARRNVSTGVNGSSTGIKLGTNPFDPDNQVPVFGGEALWEAGQNAGIASWSQLTNAPIFVSKPSKPAYDSYEKYNAEMRLKTRGFSIVPEFRIDSHLEHYVNFDSVNIPEKFNTFEIPGTNITSATSSFYQDYSNSEFLRQFMEVKETTGLNPKEIKLVCSASIKFQPYKGFYPAERTLQMVERFKNSYLNQISVAIRNPYNLDNSPTKYIYKSEAILSAAAGAIRPICEALFAPGILYNSIKSGLAVDYPVMFDKLKTIGQGVGWSSASYNNHDYNIGIRRTIPAGQDQSFGSLLGISSSFWDRRVSFESIINPEIMGAQSFVDITPHPSCSLEFPPGGQPAATSSVVATLGASGDKLYTLMSRNFFGGVADFFLKDSKFSSLESSILPDNIKFGTGEVYMARIKLRRSFTGRRDYSFESASFDQRAYSINGARAFYADEYPINTIPKYQLGSEYFELPQDPVYAPQFAESFTMYSRPSAFGPPLIGALGNISGAAGSGLRITPYSASFFSSGSLTSPESTGSYQIMDSRTGFNWSYTPPYYNGESWVDLVFRPTASVVYDLERILAETKTACWRVDPGPKAVYWHNSAGVSASIYTGVRGGGLDPEMVGYGFSSYTSSTDAGVAYTSLIHDPYTSINNRPVPGAPYGGSLINDVAMQATSSLNIFGIESIPKMVTNAQGQLVESTTETIGKKWIIQTKWESPMLNFNDKHGINPVTASNGNKTITNAGTGVFASGSIANGMWHQFGTIPTGSNTGVFLEIQDISQNWLKNHYSVRTSGSIYNNFTPDYRGKMYKEVKSLGSLCKFTPTNRSTRIGELKDSLTVKEAIIAVPYISDPSSDLSNLLTTLGTITNKAFFRLPVTALEVSLDDLIGTPVGDSEDLSGQSIRTQVRLMQDYVLPPQLDFITNRSLDPVVMYIFEFSHTFDKDDLSYMWQNLMPRNYGKFEIKGSSVSHTLANNELLSADGLIDNNNLRWQVFKVKQRVQSNYFDKQTSAASTPAGGIAAGGTIITSETSDEKYKQYNWPYDYFSIIEAIKVDVKVNYNDRIEETATAAPPGSAGGDAVGSADTGAGASAAPATGDPA